MVILSFKIIEMKKLLIINSSARSANSHSRKLTEIFIRDWKNKHVNPTIIIRELGNTAVPHVNEKWIAAISKREALRTEEEMEVLKISNTYISELHAADVIVLGVPMYNWSIPSALKAYIDQIMRINETWKLNPENKLKPYTGLLKDKTLFLLLARGSNGYESGELNQHMNHQSTYLKTIFNVMGINNIHEIAVNGTSLDVEELNLSINKAQQLIKDHIEMELANFPRA